MRVDYWLIDSRSFAPVVLPEQAERNAPDMIRKTILALLVLAAWLTVPSGAQALTPPDPTGAHPHFVRADTQSAGSWTGYRASIQIRPLTYAVWPGGYLTDGTFVQNGLAMVPGYGLMAFAWATSTTVNVQSFIKIDPKAGSWITFELTQTAGRWTFRYQDATGWHRQGSFVDSARLSNVQYVVESWTTAFSSQVMRGADIRSGTVWTIPALAHSPSDENCGHELITRSAPSSLVFRSVTTTCAPYRVL